MRVNKDEVYHLLLFYKRSLPATVAKSAAKFPENQ